MKTGWEKKRLAEVCLIKPPKNEARRKLKDSDKVSFVPMEDLGINQKYFATKQERILSEVEGSYTYFANNDVLLAKITPCFENGKLGIAKNLNNKIGFGSSEYIVFRPSECLSNEFLYYFLSREEFRVEGAKRMNGAVGHKRVSKEFIESSLIPIPSLSEQKRIVCVLDEAVAAIGQAKENAEKNLKNAREFFESCLQRVFEKPNESWETCALEKYVRFIDYRGRTPKKTLSGVPLITAKNVKNGFLQKTPEEFIDPKNYVTWMTRGIPRKGDVIFTTEAPLANVAQLDTDEKVAFAQRIIVMQPQKEKINQTFLKYLLLSNPIRKKILEKGTGATVKGIKAKMLKKIEIYFPSVSEQVEIAHKINAISLEVGKLEIIYQAKMTELEILEKCILEKAFSGELSGWHP